MFIREDFNYKPSVGEISIYIRNGLFDKFCLEMDNQYEADFKVEFSKCNWEYGWNLKFKKSGKSLCTIYPRENYFTVLVVIGKKEKEKLENILSELSNEVQWLYYRTKEGNNQKWLMIDLEDMGEVYNDVLRLINIRYESK